jgi:group I intron endonuclease
MGFIYCITNKLNGKKYIGQTKLTVPGRWKAHQRATSRCVRLRAALEKHGVDNFECETILECPDDELDDHEVRLIAEHDTVNKGYNCSPGGQGQREYTDEMRKAQSERMKGRTMSDETKKLISLQAIKWEVDQITLDGVFVQRFESVTAAATAMDVKKSTIARACNLENGSSSGFKWRWVEEHKPSQPCPSRANAFRGKHHTPETKALLRQKCTPVVRKVDQFSFDGKFVKRFDCLRDAADSVASDVKGVREACDGNVKYAKGYMWHWVVDPEGSPEDIAPLAGCHIEKLTLAGELLERYLLLKDAAASVNAHVNSLKAALDREPSQCKGFLWRKV